MDAVHIRWCLWESYASLTTHTFKKVVWFLFLIFFQEIISPWHMMPSPMKPSGQESHSKDALVLEWIGVQVLAQGDAAHGSNLASQRCPCHGARQEQRVRRRGGWEGGKRSGNGVKEQEAPFCGEKRRYLLQFLSCVKIVATSYYLWNL